MVHRSHSLSGCTPGHRVMQEPVPSNGINSPKSSSLTSSRSRPTVELTTATTVLTDGPSKLGTRWRTRDREGVLRGRERSQEGSPRGGIGKWDVDALHLRRSTTTEQSMHAVGTEVSSSVKELVLCCTQALHCENTGTVLCKHRHCTPHGCSHLRRSTGTDQSTRAAGSPITCRNLVTKHRLAKTGPVMG